MKLILGIETSCDETAAAVLQEKKGRIHILSNVVASSAPIQSKYGGVIPEQAAREQLHSIIPVVDAAISNSKCQISNIDAVAVTYGPGLIGSLLVGVETTKTLALIWNKPLIPVNHLLGHFYANFISSSPLRSNNKFSPAEPKENGEVPSFPCIGLLVSGGHTDLVLFTSHGKYIYLGGTRDDAAGECFDKCARLLGLSYPGGPAIAQRAMEFKIQDSKFEIKLPRPLINEKSFDFSFSGLKTAVAREVEKLKAENRFNEMAITQLSYETQQAIIDVLVEKTLKAIQKNGVKELMIAGGVASNEKLVQNFKFQISNSKLKIKLHVPSKELCTDNGAMIASAAFFLPCLQTGKAGIKPIKNPLSLQADPNLSLIIE